MNAKRTRRPPTRSRHVLRGRADLARVRGIKNIHLLGKKNYSELPNYYRAVDVCIVAFQRTEHIRYSCPTRFYEHLAAGKPVVSTDFPAAREFPEDMVRIAKDKEEFEQLVSESLKPGQDAFVERRKKLARENSWDGRAEKISQMIEAGIS